MNVDFVQARSAVLAIVTAIGLSLIAAHAEAQTPPHRYRPHFPSGAPWYQDVIGMTPDPNSATMITQSVGWGTGNAGGTAFQIDFSMHVLYTSWGGSSQHPLIEEGGYYLPDCDEDTPIPLPAIGAIEGSTDYTCDLSNDCHLFVVHGYTLYESYQTFVDNSGGLNSLCLVKWHLNRVYPQNGRGDGCTSADAAGFPMAPLITNADEVSAALVGNGGIGYLNHALRFIMPNDRMRANVYVYPASHIGSPNSPNGSAIPYGAHLRLRSNFDMSNFNAAAQVILRTLQHYGMFLSDGGSIPLTFEDDMFTTLSWSDPTLNIDSHSLFGVALNDFDVMPIGAPVPSNDCVRNSDDQIFADGVEY